MEKITCRKLKMTQVWAGEKVVPVTVLKVEEDGGVFDLVKKGSKITLKGTTKGKGFQGVVKRYGFAGGPKSHGQKHSHRAPGSIGSTGPQRVMPGKKMAGRMGGDTKTLKNILVADIDPEKRLIMVKGPVPGMKGTLSEIKVTTAGSQAEENNSNNENNEG